MAWYTLATLVAGLMIGADRTDAQNGIEKLQGTWGVSSGETNGERIALEDAKKPRLVVKGDLGTFMMGNEVINAGTIKLDPSKDPAEIDVTLTKGIGKGMTMRGIYQVQDGTFRVCYDPTGKERPKSFEAKPGYLCITYKK